MNRTLTNEHQRLRHTMNLNGGAAVQCTSRVSSHNPCGLHASTCLPCGTLECFLLSMAGILLSTWGARSGFLRIVCGQCWAKLSQRDAANTQFQFEPRDYEPPVLKLCAFFCGDVICLVLWISLVFGSCWKDPTRGLQKKKTEVKFLISPHRTLS